MKNLICFLFVLLLFSCNKDNDIMPIDYSIYEELSEEELRIEAEKLGAVTLQQLLEESSYLIKYEDETIEKEVGLRATGTVTVYGSNGSVVLKKNQKVLIKKSPTGVPTGVYFVDTYDVRKDAKIPSGYNAIPMDSPKCGFDPHNIGSGRRGYRIVGQTGSTVYMSTIGYKIKYDIQGRTWNRWDPSLGSLQWIVGY